MSELPDQPELSPEFFKETLRSLYKLSGEQEKAILGSNPQEYADRFEAFTVIINRVDDVFGSGDESKKEAVYLFFNGYLNEAIGEETAKDSSLLEAWQNEGPQRAMEIAINFAGSLDDVQEWWKEHRHQLEAEDEGLSEE